MNDTENSVNLRKNRWSGPGISQPASRTASKQLRLVLGLVALAAVAVLAVEAVSSYVLYRHFARLNRSFFPVGLATVELSHNVLAKAEGRHGDETIVTIDHGPLFRANDLLGYTMYPGSYRITEKRYGQSHRFNLTVDEFGRRITAAKPNDAAKHIFISGDSGMFGWGLNDEQTAPWLIQARFPEFDVVNLSLTSYSTIHALLQLENMRTKPTANDIVVLTYHPITNGFDVASDEMLGFLRSGFEYQLGDHDLVHNMVIPFGGLDSKGGLMIEHYHVIACERPGSEPSVECPHRPVGDEVTRVTELAFDRVIAAQPAHVVVALLSGPDSDPVVQHLRAKGVMIADLRADTAAPDSTDEVFIDKHAGPFWHYQLAERLGEELVRSGLIK